MCGLVYLIISKPFNQSDHSFFSAHETNVCESKQVNKIGRIDRFGTGKSSRKVFRCLLYCYSEGLRVRSASFKLLM